MTEVLNVAVDADGIATATMNSPGRSMNVLNDELAEPLAALMLIGSRDAGVRAGLRARARIRSVAVVGSEPTIMLTGPTPACRKALAKAGLQASDIDLWEINEAFAAVPMKTARDLGVSLDRVNVNGGAIALGHPLGATGAIILGTLLDELERRDLALGCATLCVGGGMGIATIIERI